MGRARACASCCKEVVRSAQAVVAGRRCVRVGPARLVAVPTGQQRPCVLSVCVCIKPGGVCPAAVPAGAWCTATVAPSCRWQTCTRPALSAEGAAPARLAWAAPSTRVRGCSLCPCVSVCLCVLLHTAGQLQSVLLCAVLLDLSAATCVSVCCWTCQLGGNRVGCGGAHRQHAGRAGQLRRIPASAIGIAVDLLLDQCSQS